MSTLTKMYTKPICMVELGLTFDLNEEKVIILEDGLLYKVKYISGNPSEDSLGTLKEFIGRLTKITPTDDKGFNPFYNGIVYNLTFDMSEDFHAIELNILTSQIRDINTYNIEEVDKENGNNESDNEDNGITGDTEDIIGGDKTESDSDGEQSEINDGSETTPGSDNGDSESDGNTDVQQPVEDFEEDNSIIEEKPAE